MNLNLKKLLLLSAIALLSSKASWSQELYPHSLAIGLNSGAGEYGYDGSNKPVFGIDLNHQRNWSRWFSFRTNLGVNYFLPAQREYQSGISLPQKVEQSRQGVNTSLTVTPLFYLRSGKFSFFIGPGFGLSNQSDFERTTSTISNETQKSKENSHYALLIARPIIGLSYSVPNKDEVELQFSPNVWLDIDELELDNIGEQVGWYTFTITYRFNFLKG